MDNRSLLQEECADKLLECKRLILKWATSTGKSRVAVLAINKIFKLYSSFDKHFKVLVVVVEITHKSGWKKEFYKFLSKEEADKVLENVVFECYASLHKYFNSDWDFIVFDEAHHLKSELKESIIRTMKATYVIALSATLPSRIINTLTFAFGKFEVFSISLQEAIDSKYLSTPKIVCIQLELEKFKKTETIEVDYRTSSSTKVKELIKDSWSNRWKYFKNKTKYKNCVIEFSCTQKEKYEYFDSQFKYWKKEYARTESIRAKNMFLQWGIKRKQFLGDLKTPKAYELCNKLRKEKTRFICFCSSIIQAECLGNRNCIHSKKKNNQYIIDLFNDKKIDELFAIGMLQEGTNLNEIQAGIIIQLDGEERGFVQKFGRTLRSKYPVQYIIYFIGTRDEDYLNKALQYINPNYITYENNN